MPDETMPTKTESAVERESLRTRNWVLAGVVGGLLLFVQVILTFLMSSATSKMDSYSTDLARVLTAVEVMTARNEALAQRVASLEAARVEAGAKHNEIDKRLNSIEQREAIHDEYMTSHK